MLTRVSRYAGGVSVSPHFVVRSYSRMAIKPSRSPRSRNQKPSKKPGSSGEIAPYKFGSGSSLKLPDDRKIKGLTEYINKVTEFYELKLLPDVRQALIDEIKENTVLKAQNYVSPIKRKLTDKELEGLVIRPTPIQKAAVRVINPARPADKLLHTYIMAAETGTGKTWAYLAPLLHKLREQELEHGQEMARKAGIKSVILLPTHELVEQVFNTVNHTSETLGTHVFKWDLNSNFREFIEEFRNGIDVLVTTPGKLASLGKYDDVQNLRSLLSRVRFCVVDEADTLMDESFMPDTYGVLKKMPGLEDLVFASATISSSLKTSVNSLFPDATPISTPSLHKIPKAIEVRVIDAKPKPYNGSRLKALAQVLYAIHCDGTEPGFEKRVIVFVNEKKQVPELASQLAEKYKHDVVSISSNDSPEERMQKLQPFIDPPKPLENPTKTTLKVLICTDLMSRGINFRGVRNVVLYNIPSMTSDLVHRMGRTGRMNQSGRAFIILEDKRASNTKGLAKVLRMNRRLE
ncbi:hypothetical protein OGAPHI_004472 [Ogataea philodendri]|uniref:RNA helicase n=1 Tax=Ogataea philodendri TaxID=1378263 RepID=A0A9P8P690_9ASCO|nr:uncharacterized protein OGAPHI_004472 [Ogataea philodendri]KAH3666283.1 hypothetical protein OGAPHI_004472 [Ogataea philodendri]